MATSSTKSGNGPEALQSQGSTHTMDRSVESPTQSGTRTTGGFLDKVKSPLYSFAPDSSPEFMKRVQDITNSVAKTLDRTLAISALGGDVEKPFSATRDGEEVHLVFPQHVKDGDLLGSLITVLASQIPTCIIHQGSAGWSEPEWTAESRAHLAGLIAGIRQCPDSFSHSSSPTDLARVSIWLTTASAALSVPGGVANAHGDVLPSALAGGKSASKYMTKLMASLRSNITDESMTTGVSTLAMLLKVWQRHHYSDALSIVRKCKLSWSSVLFRGAPTKIIKGKRNKPDQTIVCSPPKPSRSPWLSTAERAEIGNLFKAKWSGLDKFRDEWVVLSAEQQHRQFNAFIKRIKSHYEDLNNIANSVHAKLGKRKHWIETFCKEDGFKPKVKRNESESYILSAHFYQKANLKSFDMKVKKVFAPVTYMVDHDKQLEIWNNCFPSETGTSCIMTAVDFNQKDDGDYYRLWQIWAELFVPKFTFTEPTIEEAQPVEDRNIFSALLGIAKKT